MARSRPNHVTGLNLAFYTASLDTDTLKVFGLDHMLTEQEAAPEEIEALQEFMTREGTCVMLGPHHDVGA
jgi:hypothetical protein